MVNPENLRIPVWVGVSAGFRRPEHNVRMGGSIDRIAVAADIVCSVVDRKLFDRKYRIVDEPNRVPFFIRKQAGVVTIETFSKEPAEEVDAEFIDKVLEAR